MPTPPDRRRSRIGRLIETARLDEAKAAFIKAAKPAAIQTRAELATSLGVVRQTVSRWSRVLKCGALLDDALYALDRRDTTEEVADAT